MAEIPERLPFKFDLAGRDKHAQAFRRSGRLGEGPVAPELSSARWVSPSAAF